ncbi:MULTISPECIES: YcxB family protein [unclassified Kribbella]|uniref:YcxB family protein n=1 Tax=unclassified Kribbella TaxID=2644121 RepID=UPI0033F77F63
MNISAVVEVNVWDRVRNSRRQSPGFTWFFRLLGVGYLVWVIAFDLPVPYLLVAVVAGLTPELRGAVTHLRSRKYGRTYTYLVTDEGINIRTRLTNLDVAWEAITHCRETERHWVLRFPGGGLLHVPKHALGSADRQAIREVLARHRLIKGAQPRTTA